MVFFAEKFPVERFSAVVLHATDMMIMMKVSKKCLLSTSKVLLSCIDFIFTVQILFSESQMDVKLKIVSQFG